MSAGPGDFELGRSEATAGATTPPDPHGTKIPENFVGMFQYPIMDLLKALKFEEGSIQSLNLDGVCFAFGISTGVLAGLTGQVEDIEKLKNRLKLLPKYPDNPWDPSAIEDYKAKIQVLAETMKRTELALTMRAQENPGSNYAVLLTDSEQELIDLRNWLENLLAMQKTTIISIMNERPNTTFSETPLIENKYQSLLKKEILTLFTPQGINQSLLHSSEPFQGKWSDSGLEQWLKNIQAQSEENAKPISIVINLTHAVSINYNSAEKFWTLNDANNGIVHFSPSEINKLIGTIQRFTYQNKSSPDSKTYLEVFCLAELSQEKVNSLSKAHSESISPTEWNIFYLKGIIQLRAFNMLENYLPFLKSIGLNLNDIRYEDENGDTPLHLAVRSGNAEMVALLLKHGHSADPINAFGMTPLHTAIADENIEIVKLLLQHHPDIHVKNSQGMSPLELAKASDQPEIITLLQEHEFLRLCRSKDGRDYDKLVEALSSGQDPNFRLNNQSPLEIAIYAEDIDIIRVLLSHDANPNEKLSAHSRSFLHTAIDKKSPDIVELLLQHGANVYDKDSTGLSALDKAYRSPNLEILELFKAHIKTLEGSDLSTTFSAESSATASPASSGSSTPRSAVLFLSAHTDSPSPTVTPGENPLAGAGEIHAAPPL